MAYWRSWSESHLGVRRAIINGLLLAAIFYCNDVAGFFLPLIEFTFQLGTSGCSGARALGEFQGGYEIKNTRANYKKIL